MYDKNVHADIYCIHYQGCKYVQLYWTYCASFMHINMELMENISQYTTLHYISIQYRVLYQLHYRNWFCVVSVRWKQYCTTTNSWNKPEFWVSWAEQFLRFLLPSYAQWSTAVDQSDWSFPVSGLWSFFLQNKDRNDQLLVCFVSVNGTFTGAKNIFYFSIIII